MKRFIYKIFRGYFSKRTLPYWVILCFDSAIVLLSVFLAEALELGKGYFYQHLYSVIGFVITLIEGRRTPLVVPDSQMENFIKVASHYEADLVYYRPEELNLSKGDYVRIIGGAFNGAKGQLIKIDGKRNKRFVVTIPNILSATVYLEPEFMQKITKEEFNK